MCESILYIAMMFIPLPLKNLYPPMSMPNIYGQEKRSDFHFTMHIWLSQASATGQQNQTESQMKVTALSFGLF